MFPDIVAPCCEQETWSADTFAFISRQRAGAYTLQEIERLRQQNVKLRSQLGLLRQALGHLKALANQGLRDSTATQECCGSKGGWFGCQAGFPTSHASLDPKKHLAIPCVI